MGTQVILTSLNVKHWMILANEMIVRNHGMNHAREKCQLPSRLDPERKLLINLSFAELREAFRNDVTKMKLKSQRNFFFSIFTFREITFNRRKYLESSVAESYL